MPVDVAPSSEPDLDTPGAAATTTLNPSSRRAKIQSGSPGTLSGSSHGSGFTVGGAE